MVEVAQHPNITLYTYSELESLDGFIGNFKARIRKKARGLDEKLCNGCGMCTIKCATKKIPSEFNAGMGMRTAIYVPFPQAVPNKPVIDRLHCLYYAKGRCRICEKTCPTKAIRFDQEDTIIEEDVGAVVIATGFDVKEADFFPEYGYGKYKDVINGLKFERLLSASGPTLGEVRRPSDGKVPEKVVFIACAGSRDKAKGIEYCSKICCMYTAKHAMLYKHKVHDGQAHVFYMDIRSGGKGYDEFVRRAIEQDGARYYRGRVSKITEENGKLMVRGADTLSGEPVTVEADLVVLAAAMRPAAGVEDLARKLNIGYDEFGFLMESHPKLRPVETNTAGVYICGACHAPKDIPESVAQASAAASKVQLTFSGDALNREPEIARVNSQTCAACFRCVEACSYHAIERSEIRARNGSLIKRTARVNPGLCMGCGTCVAICPSKSVDLAGFTEQEIYAEVEALA
jgi:heterodisulfide reductase subunit A